MEQLGLKLALQYWNLCVGPYPSIVLGMATVFFPLFSFLGSPTFLELAGSVSAVVLPINNKFRGNIF